MQIVVDSKPNDADRDIIVAGLRAFNASAAGRPRNFMPLAVLLTDDANQTVGGLWGEAVLDWLFIELLYVPENLRGHALGTQLMAKAEAFARDNKLVGIWLDTFSFQARPFYEKLGYRVFGTIENYPPGGARYFLSKTL